MNSNPLTEYLEGEIRKIVTSGQTPEAMTAEMLKMLFNPDKMENPNHDLGFNMMIWDCLKQGCFNVLCRLKIEVFADCFPGKMAMGDIDGVMEINGHFLYLEGKHPVAFRDGDPHIPTGQRRTQEAWVDYSPSTVCAVEVNAKTMQVRRFRFTGPNQTGQWVDGDLAALKAKVKEWGEYAMAAPRPPRIKYPDGVTIGR